MSLTCENYDTDDVAWYYIHDSDLKPLATVRSRRCCSCGERIKVGDPVTKFKRFRPPKSDIEERIYGEDGEIYMANQYMCEPCSDLAENLGELGYCTPPGDDMRELVKEYAEMVKAEQEENAGWRAAMAGDPLPEDATPSFKLGHNKWNWDHRVKSVTA